MILIDTGPIVAGLIKTDQYHDWAVAQLSQHKAPLHTCDAVIAEAMYLIQRYGGDATQVLRLISRGVIRVTFSLEEESRTLEQLMRKYADLPMDLADACLVRMYERYPQSTVLTLDRDFFVYRARGKDAIDVISPL